MAKLLLSIKERTPEVKSFVGAHDFFYVVNAISELVDPLPVVFDAVHASLALHEDHHDQYHQLLNELRNRLNESLTSRRAESQDRILDTIVIL